MNSSEQADFAQWSQSQQKAFPGQPGEPSTSGLWPVGSHPELDVPDVRQINPSPNISLFLAHVQGDSLILLYCDSPLSYKSPLSPPPIKMTPFSNFEACSSQGHQTSHLGLSLKVTHNLSLLSHTRINPRIPDTFIHMLTHINRHTCIQESQQ